MNEVIIDNLLFPSEPDNFVLKIIIIISITMANISITNLLLYQHM